MTNAGLVYFRLRPFSVTAMLLLTNTRPNLWRESIGGFLPCGDEVPSRVKDWDGGKQMLKPACLRTYLKVQLFGSTFLFFFFKRTKVEYATEAWMRKVCPHSVPHVGGGALLLLLTFNFQRCVSQLYRSTGC